MTICEKNKCTACGACEQICPQNAVQMSFDENGFFYPRIDDSKCIQCKQCIRVCHNNNVLEVTPASFYMGTHKDIDVLKKSSSGGAFTALSEYVIKKGGVVFGASFDEKTRKVYHVSIKSADELDRIRLSKYYQGTIDKCYQEVKEYLKCGFVLFSGTACQIAGLYSFLGGKDDNLITVDVLCHGVTSKKVVDSYIRGKEKKYGKKAISYRFRLKPDDSVWFSGGSTKMRVDFDDGTSMIEPAEKDTFFIGFNKYLFLRESCYTCKYVGTNRISDFTLADYWGVDIEDISIKEHDYGVSLILANSNRAKQIVTELTDSIEIKPINPEVAIKCNQALSKPSTKNRYRLEFFNEIDRTDFDKLIIKYNKRHFIKVKIKDLLGRDNIKKIKKLLGK